MKSYETKSESETKGLGRRLARVLKPGDVVALSGQLGAGKTTFVKGFAEELGVPAETVASPTFVLVHEYDGRYPIYHMDWYRLDSIEELDKMSLGEYFNGDSVVVVEWADKAPDILPKDHVKIVFEHGPSKDSRLLPG
jgi:tRNA threonylcarbamoyladenosine biosynthesis protein TsaE